MAEPELIRDHWHRAGPVNPDGTDGYWICVICGGHRGYHLQAEGAWLLPLHPVRTMRTRPNHCRTCGRHHSHTTHTPWLWSQLDPKHPHLPRGKTMIENMDGELVDVLTWQNSGLSAVEIQIMRNVAHQYPDGAYAKFVRMLDQQDTNTAKETP